MSDFLQQVHTASTRSPYLEALHEAAQVQQSAELIQPQPADAFARLEGEPLTWTERMNQRDAGPRNLHVMRERIMPQLISEFDTLQKVDRDALPPSPTEQEAIIQQLRDVGMSDSAIQAIVEGRVPPQDTPPDDKVARLLRRLTSGRPREGVVTDADGEPLYFNSQSDWMQRFGHLFADTRGDAEYVFLATGGRNLDKPLDRETHEQRMAEMRGRSEDRGAIERFGRGFVAGLLTFDGREFGMSEPSGWVRFTREQEQEGFAGKSGQFFGGLAPYLGLALFAGRVPRPGVGRAAIVQRVGGRILPVHPSGSALPLTLLIGDEAVRRGEQTYEDTGSTLAAIGSMALHGYATHAGFSIAGRVFGGRVSENIGRLLARGELRGAANAMANVAGAAGTVAGIREAELIVDQLQQAAFAEERTYFDAIENIIAMSPDAIGSGAVEGGMIGGFGAIHAVLQTRYFRNRLRDAKTPEEVNATVDAAEHFARMHFEARTFLRHQSTERLAELRTMYEARAQREGQRGDAARGMLRAIEHEQAHRRGRPAPPPEPSQATPATERAKLIETADAIRARERMRPRTEQPAQPTTERPADAPVATPVSTPVTQPPAEPTPVRPTEPAAPPAPREPVAAPAPARPTDGPVAAGQWVVAPDGQVGLVERIKDGNATLRILGRSVEVPASSLTPHDWQAADAERRANMVQMPTGEQITDTAVWAEPGQEKAVAKAIEKMEQIARQKPRRAGKPRSGPVAVPTAAKPAAVIKTLPKQIDAVAKLAGASSRYSTDGVLVAGDSLIVTDGRTMHSVRGEWGIEDGMYRNAKGKLSKYTTDTGDKPTFPDYRGVTPAPSDSPITVKVADVMRHAYQASLFATSEGPGVLMFRNADGTVGFASNTVELGHAEINIREGATPLAVLDPKYIRDAMKLHSGFGATEVQWHFTEANKPVRIDSERVTSVIMPMEVPERIIKAMKEGQVEPSAPATPEAPEAPEAPGSSAMASIRPDRTDPQVRSEFIESVPDGEATPWDRAQRELEGEPFRDGLGPDIMEAGRLLAAQPRYAKLRGLMAGVFRYAGRVSRIELGDIRWLRTLSHEVGHAVDYRLNGDSFPSSIKRRFPSLEIKEAQAREELKRASEYVRPLPEGLSWSDTNKSHIKYRASHPELMADLISLHTLRPEKARELAPNVTQALEQAIEADAFVNAAMQPIINPLAITEPTKPRGKSFMPEPAPKPEPTIHDPGLEEQAMDVLKITSRTMASEMLRVTQTARQWERRHTQREREDIAAFVEGIGNISVKGDTIEAVKARMTPEMHQTAREYRYEQELNRQEANKLFAEAGSGAEAVKYVENYIGHLYIGTGRRKRDFSTRWTKRTPHMAQRTLPTLKDAVDAGLTPVTQDMAYLYKRTAENNFKAALSRRFARRLKDMRTTANEPVMVSKLEEAGPDWARIDHPVLRHVYARKSKDGTLILGEGVAYVHPSIARPVKVLLDRPFDNGAFHAIQAINAAGKSINVSFSIFHNFALVESSQAANASFLNPLRGIFIGPFESKRLGLGFWPHLTHRAGLHMLENDPVGVQDAVEHGLNIGPSASADYARSFLERRLREFEAVTRDIPGLALLTKALRLSYEPLQKALWDHLHVGLKVFTYNRLAAEILANPPVGMSPRQIKESIAARVNNMFGGQEFLQTLTGRPMTVKESQVAHAAVFAPDWTWSNIRVAADPVVNFKDPVARKLGIRYWRNMAFTLFAGHTLAQYAIWLAFGQDDEDAKPYPWLNEPGRTFDVDVTPLRNSIYQSVGMEAPEGRIYVHAGKQALEVVRYFSDFPNGLLQNVGNKQSVAMRILYEQMTSHQAGSGFPMPWQHEPFTENMKGWRQVVERAKSVGEHFLPFSWQPNNFAFALPKRGGMSQYRAVRYYEEAIRGVVDPSWWQQYTDGGTVEQRRDAIVQLVRDTDAALAANGVSEQRRQAVWSQALARVRSGYYDTMLEALENQKFDKAEDAARILIRLGAGPDGVEQSAIRRDMPEDIQSDARIIMQDAAEYSARLRYEEIVGE